MVLNFSKKEEEILKLKLRRRIYELVEKFSGCNFRHLERKSEISTGTLQYHLNYLVKHRIITTEKDGNKIRYFTREISYENKKILSFLRQKNIRDILLIILKHKKIQQKDVIKLLNLSGSTVYLYLNRLVESNILKTVRKDRGVYYQLNVREEEVVKLLVTYKESLLDSLVEQTLAMWEF